MGGHWTTSRVAFLVQQGLRLMAESANGTTEPLGPVDDEEDFDDLIELEDDSDD